MKQQFPRITLSGVDERTDMEALDQLALRNPLEIAILYTVAPDGRNRYPSAAWAIGVSSGHVSAGERQLRTGSVRKSRDV